MENKSTDNLQSELMSMPSLDEFLSENSSNFNNDTVADLLNNLLASKYMSKATLAKQSGISEVYLHQIFAGKRNPSRNRLICLCYGLGVTLEDANNLLKHCGVAQLYSSNRRDAILIFGLVHGLSLFEINDKLFVEDEESLF